MEIAAGKALYLLHVAVQRARSAPGGDPPELGEYSTDFVALTRVLTISERTSKAG
jgi:hypothetical protein